MLLPTGHILHTVPVPRYLRTKKWAPIDWPLKLTKGKINYALVLNWLSLAFLDRTLVTLIACQKITTVSKTINHRLPQRGNLHQEFFRSRNQSRNAQLKALGRFVIFVNKIWPLYWTTYTACGARSYRQMTSNVHYVQSGEFIMFDSM